MADSKSVHMARYFREFCAKCCVTNRIVCSSVENIEEEGVRGILHQCNIPHATSDMRYVTCN